jgi:2-dehydro-3-deoxyphosphogluconate aldolase/(4S)-4-hydroxy-2-oxoglutarate aldolase
LPIREEMISAFEILPIIGIVRDFGDENNVVSKVQRLIEVGIRAIEVTTNTTNWKKAVSVYSRETMIGVGTVLTVKHVEEAADAGARFVVSPGISTKVIERALSLGLEPIPGALSPTEITVALDSGAHFVKIFPAGPLGAEYFTAIRGPFADVSFIPTGGIEIEDVKRWIDLGATAVGLGTKLTSASVAEIEEQLVNLVRDRKGGD